MATHSFAEISNYNWQPTTAYQAIQSMIQNEVNQGLWANQIHPNDWCCISTTPPQGAQNSWVTYTYQRISDHTQTDTVTWPVGWPAPADNINGQLPSHFFTGTTNGSGATSEAMGVSIGVALFTAQAAPSSSLAYKPAGECM